MWDLGEAIRVMWTGYVVARHEIAARYRQYLIVVFIALEQFAAESEETLIGDDVIFEDDSPVHVIEEPPDGSGYAEPASEVAFLKQGFDLRIPVDPACECSTRMNALSICGMRVAWTVYGEEDMTRSCGAKCVDHPFQVLGPVESDEQNGLCVSLAHSSEGSWARLARCSKRATSSANRRIFASFRLNS